MREIKFRAWSESFGGYIWPSSIDLVNKEIHGLPFDIQEAQDEITICGLESLEQFTGLYDRTKWSELSEEERICWTLCGNMPSEWKGREIYEGDILKCCSCWSASYPCYRNIVAKIWANNERHEAGINVFSADPYGPEIIGNIHENKGIEYER